MYFCSGSSFDGNICIWSLCFLKVQRKQRCKKKSGIWHNLKGKTEIICVAWRNKWEGRRKQCHNSLQIHFFFCKNKRNSLFSVPKVNLTRSYRPKEKQVRFNIIIQDTSHDCKHSEPIGINFPEKEHFLSLQKCQSS